MYRNVVSSALWMFAGNASQQVLQFVTFIILARQLAPDIFGQVALAAIVVDIAAAIGNWGLPSFLTQRGILTAKIKAHAFALCVIVAVILSVAIAAGVGIYAYLYGFGLISQLILLLVPVLWAQALSIVPEAIVRRNLEFKWLAVQNNLAALLGGAVALAMAFSDMGVYALIVQKLVALYVMATTVWFAAGRKMKFLRLKDYRLRTFVMISKQSLRILSNQISTLLGVRAMDGIIGLHLGEAVLGQFKIVWRIYDLLTQLALTPLSSVAFAAFPKLLSDNQGLRTFYNNMISLTLALYVSMLTGLAFTADQWVPLILSDKWLGIIPLFAILSVTSVQCVLGTYQNYLQMAMRWNHFILKQNIARLVISVSLTYIAAQISIEMVLVFYAVFAYGLAVYNMWAIDRDRGWPWTDTAKSVYPSIIAAGFMVVVLKLLDGYIAAEAIALLVANVAIGAASYGAVLFLLSPSLAKQCLKFVKTRKLGAV